MILIVEDEYSNYQFLFELLSSISVKIVHAYNGQQAVEICKKNQQIQVVLMDIKMPIMNGIEATSIIKSINPEVPVIDQTAYAFNIEREKVMAAGCNDYITKPISKKLLMMLLDKYFKSAS